MNLVFNSISLQGFKSFDKKQTFSFSNLEKGLYFVTGENQVEPQLGANGAGKSTLLVESSCWILYGKTSTNLKAGNVKNWQSKELCEVVLDFNTDADNYILRRTQSPNSITLSKNNGESKTVTDEEIVLLINLDFNSFLYSIVVSQFGSKFFDLQPAEKMDVFASVMEDSLACWMDYSDKAKAKKQEIETKIETNERDLSKNSGQIETLQSQDYSRQIEEFESNKTVDLALLADQIQCKDADIFNLYSELKKTQIALEDVIKDIKEVTDLKDKFQENLQGIESDVKEVQEVVSSIKAESNFYAAQYTKMEKLEEGNCPTCNQVISEEHIVKELEALKEKISALSKDEKEATELLAEAKNSFTKLKTELSEYDNELRYAEKDKSNYEYTIRNINQDINRAESDKKSLITNKKTIEEKVNPYKELQIKNAQEITKLRGKKKEIENELKSLQEDKAIYEYWVKGFKDIRFMVLSEALAGLEISMNNNLQKLGMEDWEIVLSVDSETKKGTTRKGFTVLVKSPTNKELVPFECWSGGEGQRLRLCGVVGLAQFILDRKGIVCNIECMDEPSQHLSELGVESLVNLLHDRAEDEDKKIFFIDHKGLENLGVFKSIVTVVKDKDGSHIQIGE